MINKANRHKSRAPRKQRRTDGRADGRTHGQTHGQTDRRTDKAAYIVACTRLETTRPLIKVVDSFKLPVSTVPFVNKLPNWRNEFIYLNIK